MIYNGDISLKWMIWGYPHFRKPPFRNPIIYRILWIYIYIYYIHDFLKMEESPKPIGCHARMVIHDLDDLVDYSHGNGNLQSN